MTDDEIDGIIAKLTKAQRAFLCAVCDGTSIGLADRQQDKVRQSMRRQGLTEVAKNPRRWRATLLGLRVRSRLSSMEVSNG